METITRVGRTLSQSKLLRTSGDQPATLQRSNSSTKVVPFNNPSVERLKGETLNKARKESFGPNSSFANFQTLNERKDDIDSKTPEVTVSRITLRFPDKGLEEAFAEYYFKSSLRKVRLGIVLVLLFEILVGLMDLSLKDEIGFGTVSKLLIIRYGGICPVFILTGAFTFSREFPKLMQVSTSALHLRPSPLRTHAVHLFVHFTLLVVSYTRTTRTPCTLIIDCCRLR